MGWPRRPQLDGMGNGRLSSPEEPKIEALRGCELCGYATTAAGHNCLSMEKDGVDAEPWTWRVQMNEGPAS